MKIDVKVGIIIALVGVIGVLVGVIIGGGVSKPSADQNLEIPAVANVPADDGKLARAYKQNEIVTVIRENALDIQKCYLDLLEGKEEVIEGDIKFVMTLAEDGRILSTRIISNDMNDEKFGTCVMKKLESYSFAPPPLGINRNIGHELAFKSQETAEREAKERSKKSALPKVLPVGAEGIPSN